MSTATNRTNSSHSAGRIVADWSNRAALAGSTSGCLNSAAMIMPIRMPKVIANTMRATAMSIPITDPV